MQPKKTIIAALSLATAATAGPIGYGICQAGCAAVVTACYAGAGFTFGTVSPGRPGRDSTRLDSTRLLRLISSGYVGKDTLSLWESDIRSCESDSGNFSWENKMSFFLEGGGECRCG
ncbi:hypothetical protein KVR01_013629 [Diaporthe batatas]|uniref:uncharacterized protein n=1 Tax=Diaporthe batatas TaxID=748121 RepID=UPI001D04E15E|nr:uncharacterized protein KVR01_013629 [Diaporthe batatas]KAG8156525.1 hypothetical protein KVR01_013629 [Diaporthe batatas]